MDKEKLFKDNILLINENYKLNNQLNMINNNLKSAGITKENLKEIVDKLKVFKLISFCLFVIQNDIKNNSDKNNLFIVC